MTNLLRETVKKANIASLKKKKYIKLPAFNEKDKPHVTFRKFTDYMAKVRFIEYGEMSLETIYSLAKKNDDTCQLLKFDDFAKTDDTSKETCKYLRSHVIKNMRANNLKSTDIESLIKRSGILIFERRSDSFGKTSQIHQIVIDDALMPMDAKQLEANYYKVNDPNRRLFSYTTVSTLELKSESDLIKSGSNSVLMRSFYNMVFTSYDEAFNDELNNLMSFDSGKKIATIRSDKKYQDDDLNHSTLFNQLGFRKIEVDTARYEGAEFDYTVFKTIENDWSYLCNQLPHTEAPELKFRKLGKHKATGIYVPSKDIVAVDVRSTESFIHEYGHHIDFTYLDNGEQISRQKAFKVIHESYVEELKHLAPMMPHKDFTYFKTPTEAFARAFELWVSETRETSGNRLLKQPSIYAKEVEYKAFIPVKQQVIAYFDNLFKDYQTTRKVLFSVEKKRKKVNYDRFTELEPTNVGEQISLF